MIISFKDKDTEVLYRTGKSKRIPPDVIKRALRLLDRVDQALGVEDLRIPPSNRLEKLKGISPERWSVRINRQYRITFVWTGKDAADVVFEDYH